MDATFFIYLLKSSFCLLFCAFLYRLCLSRLTHFRWMRFYLLFALILSVALPFVDISTISLIQEQSASSEVAYVTQQAFDWMQYYALAETANENTPLSWVISMLSWIYLAGFLYSLLALLHNLYSLISRIYKYKSVDQGAYKLVHTDEEIAAYSFFRYMFLGEGFAALNQPEKAQVMAHERLHIQQKHSFDILLYELIHLLFWFHPTFNYLKKSLKEVHEYLADEAVMGTDKKSYAYLLLKLASPAKSLALATSFSNKQLQHRIHMLMKTRTLARKKLYFLFILPLMASFVFLFSCMDNSQEELSSVTNDLLSEENKIQDGKKIASISWEGNQVYDDQKLNSILGLKAGDFYNEELINSHLNFNPNQDNISSLYMDHGYLFFNLQIIEEPQADQSVALRFEIYEGQQVKNDQILIKGNKNISRQDILDQLQINEGEYFNRRALIASQKALATTGWFDSENIGINPIPHPEKGTVDIEFILTEKDSQ